jgi:hypothetical protein
MIAWLLSLFSDQSVGNHFLLSYFEPYEITFMNPCAVIKVVTSMLLTGLGPYGIILMTV